MRKLISSPIAAIFLVSGILSVAVLIAAHVVGNGFLNGPAESMAFIAIGALAAKTRRAGAPVGAAIALIGQAIAFTTAFQGHPWQIDSHMLFFALLASLVSLRSVPALLTGTVITAVHHLSFTIFMPALVYPSVDLAENLGRTVFHAVIVVMETIALVLTLVHLKRLDAKMAEQTKELEASLTDAEAAREESESARISAQTLQKQAEDATAQAEKLLVEAKEAAQEREIANREHQEAQMEAARQQEAKAEEQNEVVQIINDVLEKLREGDLTVRIEGWMPEAYEGLRRSFNATTETLEQMVSEVSNQSLNIENEVAEIVAAASDLAKRTEHQALTLSDAASDLAALTEKVNLASKAVDESTTSATLANSNAQESERIVTEASEVMNTVHEESQEISKIVQVIDQIAFQTNLLALNAGVEAARAGEAGRGFAVVASEVRALSQRSSESATNIRELIERSGGEVEKGTTKIAETVSSLKSVLEAVAEISEKSSVITQTTHEQRNAVHDLNAKITDLDGATQRNAAMFEETSAACSVLLNGTSALRKLTENFRVSSSVHVNDVAA